MLMRIGVLFSGGKDSLYSAYLTSHEHDVVCLITIIPENKDSYMFHTPNIEFVDIQAEAMELPLVKIKSKGIKEEELKDLKKAIEIAKEKYKIQGIVAGAIASNYQTSRIKRICDELGLECLNPLWQRNQIELLSEMLKQGIKFIIVGIAADSLDEKWLGEEIDSEHINRLKELERDLKINPAGEGGEIETFVIDSPMHKKSIKIIKAEKLFSEHTGIFKIKKIKL